MGLFVKARNRTRKRTVEVELPNLKSEHVAGNIVEIPNGDGALLTWDSSNGPDEILDLSNPQIPKFIESGFYVIAVPVSASALTSGGRAVLQLTMDYDNNGWTSGAAIGHELATVVTICGYAEAGTDLRLNVANFDGSAARNFVIVEASILKVG